MGFTLFVSCPWLKDKGRDDVKAVQPLSLPFLAQPVGGVLNVDCPCAFLAAMLNEVRWCHAGQVTLCAEPSCHRAETVPQECQSVIIILMTCIALLAMSSLVCAKANEQRPNCKINWKTFWLKTTLPSLSFLHFLLFLLSLTPVLSCRFSFHLFYSTNMLLIEQFPSHATCFFSMICFLHLSLGNFFSRAQSPLRLLPSSFLCLFPSDSPLCCCLLYFPLTSPLLSVLTASPCLLIHLYAAWLL